MITISVSGGARPEILDLVHESKKKYPNQLQFVVFDSVPNIGTADDWVYHHCEDEAQVAELAVSFVAEGKADILLKGIIQTHTLLKELLKKEHHLRKEKVLSHVAMIDLPDHKQSFLLTDCAMNITPDKEGLIAIIENAKETALAIGIEKPKIALLSSAETVNPKMPSSVMAKELTQYFAIGSDSVVFGPLSFDLAISKEAVTHKNYQGPIMGDADVIVVPSIDTGNSLYKALTIFGGANVGGTIVGTKVPVVLTSRSDTTASKLQSLTFAIKQL